MTGIASLADSQRTAYSTLYNNLMDATQAERDSVRAAREAARDGSEGGDRESGAATSDAIKAMLKDLGDQQQAFDQALKGILSKDQWKAYEKWRRSQRPERGFERRGGMRGGMEGGGGRQGGGTPRF